MALRELKETVSTLPNEVEATVNSHLEYYKLYIFRIIAKTAMGFVSLFVVALLVLIIALFNLVGAIIMMILDKQKNLYTLFAMGMTLSQIRRIFFLQGAIISLLGAIFGVGLGVGIAWLQKAYPMLYINPNAMIPIPYPIDIRWSEIVVVFLTILILGIMASAIGASRTKIND